MRGESKARRDLRHVVAVAHPGHADFPDPAEERAGRVKEGRRLAVFARGVVLRGRDAPAEHLRHQLAAVADAEDRHAQSKQAGIDLRRVRQIHAVRPAGENDADGIKAPDLLKRHIVGMQLAIDLLLTHAAGDQLVVLPAEVEDQNLLHSLFFSFHGL